MIRTAAFGVLLLVGMLEAGAQEFSVKGVPHIDNYTPQQTGIVGKTWAIRSAPNGIIYFATDAGLLEFDGSQWQLFPGSKGFTRSIHVSSDSTLATGSDKDFGYWHRDAASDFSYTSINPFRESTKGLNEEFWGTYRGDDGYLFISFDNLYVYRDRQLTKIAAPDRFYGSAASEESFYLFDETAGVFQFDGQSLRPLFTFPPSYATPPKIVGVHDRGDALVVVTRDQGTFRWADGKLTALDGEVSPFLARDQVFCFSAINDTHYAYGTIRNGVYITDLEGNIVQHVNKQKGLLNNTVLSLHYAPTGRLWLGLDFGIAAIDLASEYTYFLDAAGQVGTGYAGVLRQGDLYLGTNQGLYVTAWEQLDNKVALPDFQAIPGSSGQVWALEEVDGKLLCGHDRGLFEVAGQDFRPLPSESGVLTISPLGSNHLVTGNYNGISLYTKENGQWRFSRKIPPVQGACNQVLPQGDSVLWLNLPNFGVIRAKLDEDRAILHQQIFPADRFAGMHPRIFQDSGRFIVVTSSAQYAYLSAKQDFTQTDRTISPPRIDNELPGVYRADSLTGKYGFLPVHNGFALQRNREREVAVPPGPLLIRSAVAFGNDTSVLLMPGAEVPPLVNHLRFRYRIPQAQRGKYQYRLKGHEPSWSAWSEDTEAKFLDLPAGKFTFQVRAKVGDRIVPEQSFSLEIAAPWYRRGWVYLCFGLLLAALLYGNHRWQEQRFQQREHQRTTDEELSQRLREANTEQDLLRKRYAMLEDGLEKVKKHLRTKTIDLARKAKENDEKGRLLQTLKDKVDLALKQGKAGKFQWKQLSRILDSYQQKQDDSFNLQLEELHQNFLITLSQRYPDLTNYDLRLCAYLKSGLSTREIAGLMNVLPSSVNVSRSRLRKKLRLSSGDDLTKFLKSIGEQE